MESKTQPAINQPLSDFYWAYEAKASDQKISKAEKASLSYFFSNHYSKFPVQQSRQIEFFYQAQLEKTYTESNQEFTKKCKLNGMPSDDYEIVRKGTYCDTSPFGTDFFQLNTKTQEKRKIYRFQNDSESKTGQSQKQNQAQIDSKSDPKDIIEQMKVIDRVWYYNKEKDPSKSFLGEPYGNIECISLEMNYSDFVLSNFQKDLQVINIGNFSVDFKHLKQFKTSEPFNKIYHVIVLRGKNHKRSRPVDNVRNEALCNERDGFQFSYAKQNYLGGMWFKIHKRYPSLNEIFIGIIKEAKYQQAKKSGFCYNSKDLHEAQTTICNAWLSILNLVGNIDRDAPFDTFDPKIATRIFGFGGALVNKITRNLYNLILRLFTMETFLYGTMNLASKFGDTAKVETLGPYACVLYKIINTQSLYRYDIDLSKFQGITLYRGCGMSQSEIDKYRTRKQVQIYGYMSTSMNIQSALDFAQGNNSTGSKPVLFHIDWCQQSLIAKISTALGSHQRGKFSYAFNQYFMDESVSAFPKEQEVLLNDGQGFEVKSVEDVVIQGRTLTQINLKAFMDQSLLENKEKF